MPRRTKEQIEADKLAENDTAVPEELKGAEVLVTGYDDDYDKPKRQRFAEILKQLSERMPDDLIKTRKQGGTELSYIEWFTAAEQLDKIAVDWEDDIESVTIVDNKLIIVVGITIRGVRRANVGIEDLTTDSYGDVASNAFAMAFKRAAALFGIARHLYKKDDPARETAKTGKATKPQSEPQAVTRSDNLVEATLLGLKKTDRGYEYLAVQVPGQKYEIKQFFNKSYELNDLLADVKAKDQVFPMKVLVSKPEKNEKGFFEINKYRPLDPVIEAQAPSAPSDTAPSSTQPTDEVPF